MVTEMNEGLSAGPVRSEPEKCEEYRPSKQEMLSNHGINIEFLSVGMIIRVGCKSIPFQSIRNGMYELNKYVEDPHAASEKWNKLFNEA